MPPQAPLSLIHIFYNTLDAIRIQAQLDGDKPVADLLMRLVDFVRLSVKVDRPMVTLDDELELLEAYLELRCVRYPELQCEYQDTADTRTGYGGKAPRTFGQHKDSFNNGMGLRSFRKPLSLIHISENTFRQSRKAISQWIY